MNYKTKYGIAEIPKGTILCSLEKGGDKDNLARHRFVESGKCTTKKIIKIVTDELVLQDLYDENWILIGQEWVKAEDIITWYDSYEKARNAYKSLTHYNRKLIIWVLITTILAIAGYRIYIHKFSNHEVNLD